MNTTSHPRRIYCSFRDRDRAAAHARLSALRDAMERRGLPAYFGECDLPPRGHATVLQCAGRDGVVSIALRTETGSYKSHGRGNPADWLLAHLESAWGEVS